MTDWTDEETDDPHYADRRNFYKVEKWSRDGLRVEVMLYAGNNLDKARRIFDRTTKHRPRVRLTIRQRMRVLDEWPRPRDDALMRPWIASVRRVLDIARGQTLSERRRHERRQSVGDRI